MLADGVYVSKVEAWGCLWNASDAPQNTTLYGYGHNFETECANGHTAT